MKVGKVIDHYKMAKHLIVEITDETFGYRRDEAKIAARATLDGVYVLRTSVESEVLSTKEVVTSYTSLSNVERVFRGFHTVLDIRPIRHRTEQRVRMLSYYVSLSMAHTLAPLLYKDDGPEGAKALRGSPVAPAK